MPRLMWDPKKTPEVHAAREVYNLYIKRRYLAKHNGDIVRSFDPAAAMLEFEPVPNAFDRLMKEEDPWEH